MGDLVPLTRSIVADDASDYDRPLTLDAEFTVIRGPRAEPRKKTDWRRLLWGIRPPAGYTPEMIEEWERLPFFQKYEFRMDWRPALGALALGVIHLLATSFH